MEKITLSGLFPEEITELLELGQNFRGKQIFKWISTGVSSFDEMTNLSLDLRKILSEKATVFTSFVSQKLVDPDGTIKLQITLQDSLCIETVLLIDSERRKTACVSCQAGCAMACAFCQTGKLGFARNLTAGEIVEQFLYLEKDCGKLDNIVFMGMGEPMMNLPEIRKAISILAHKDGRNLSTRRITISTSGVIKGIYDLADNGPAVRLAISLTTADNELRNTLMPVNKGNPLSELSKAIKYYIDKTNRRVTIEYILLRDLNDTIKHANELADLLHGLNVYINLIPYNEVKEKPFKRSTPEAMHAFFDQLKKRRLNVTLRKEQGSDIDAACGQLRSKHIK